MAARQTLGHYSDLQSLNSEDAVTWSVIGPLAYRTDWKQHFADRLLGLLGLPKSKSVAIWLWRRIPHPEKPASTGGPKSTSAS